MIDLAPDRAVTGKTPGIDLRDKVPTMPTLLLRKRVADGGATDADRALVELLDSDLSGDHALTRAVAALGGHDVVADTREQAARWAQRAVEALRPLPDGPVKRALVDFTEALVDRTA